MTLYNKYDFNLTIIPGLEELAIEEFKEIWSDLTESSLPEITSKKGKVYFNCDILDICKLVPYLRIPTQVYMRIGEFNAKDSSKLYKKLSKIEWSKFLRGNSPIITTSARESKLINTSVIKDKASAAITTSSKHSPIKAAPKGNLELRNRIHIDIYNDLVKVDLSLCGERLDRRGIKTLTDKAPIRESIAGAMIYKISKLEAGVVIDPMSGSGTFCTEIALRKTYNNFRSFDFQFAPYFITLPLYKRQNIQDKRLHTVIYSDIDNKATRNTRDNITSLKSEINFIENENSDFFKIEDHESINTLILNPPYGKRVKIEEGLIELLEKINKKVSSLSKTKYFALVFPKWAKKALKDTNCIYSTEFSNGGIEVIFMIIQQG